MMLEKYRSGKDIRYKLDGKRISAKQAQEALAANPNIIVIDNSVIQQELFSDQWAAILHIENLTGTTFYIDHTVKVEGGVFAHDNNGAKLELRDKSATLNVNGKITVYNFDIAESRFIEILKTVSDDAETFTITGDSGKVYTFQNREQHEEIVETEPAVTEVETPADETQSNETPAEKLTDYIFNRRKQAFQNREQYQKVA